MYTHNVVTYVPHANDSTVFEYRYIVHGRYDTID